MPAASAAAGTATSTAPNATPISTNTTASVRTPGARNAPPCPGGRGDPRQARDAEADAKIRTPLDSSSAQATAEAAVDQAPIAPAINTGPAM